MATRSTIGYETGDQVTIPSTDRDALVRIHEILMNIDYDSYETMDRGIRKAISVCNLRGVMTTRSTIGYEA